MVRIENREKMRVLVIGTGLLGSKILKIKKDYELHGAFHTNPPNLKGELYRLDITQKNSVLDLVSRISPDVSILTSAFTNVDGCEKERETAHEVNVTGPENVAIACERTGSKLIHISTDYVFDGEKGLYTEEDSPNPISYYGKTKLLGEEKVKGILEDYVIARTSVIYGMEKKNFAMWIVDELRKGNKIRIVTDQYVSPTLNTDLAEQIYALLERDGQGLYHTAGGERISRYDFAVKLAVGFGLDKNLIIPIKTEDLNWTARRPPDSSLDVSKISGIKKPLSIEEALTRLKEEMT